MAATPVRTALASSTSSPAILRRSRPTPSALSLRDDAAVLRPPEGQEIVLTCDTIVEGVHFLKDDPAGSIGHKALAVNLSDLAAKGARPYVYLLALALPAKPDPAWLEAFASGLGALQSRVGASLVGGDTTRTPGPLSITITALGLVPHGHAVLRLGAKRGDRLYVTRHDRRCPSRPSAAQRS